MRRAVVIGGSVAGSLCAAVLSKHAQEVTIVEREDVPDAGSSRKAVPQGRHVHG